MRINLRYIFYLISVNFKQDKLSQKKVRGRVEKVYKDLREVENHIWDKKLQESELNDKGGAESEENFRVEKEGQISVGL